MFDDALTFLDSDEVFLLSTHVNADGDGLAAMVGLASMLRALGRKYRMVINDLELDRRYVYLDGYPEIECVAMIRDKPTFGRAVLLDTPTVSERRIGNVADLITDDTKVLIIDHHQSEDGEGDVRLIDQGASATSELVLRLIQAAKVEVTPEIATQIYTGIAFDTKLFKFSNPERGLKACAELVGYGADPREIADILFARESYETLATLGSALSSLHLHYAGRVASLHIEHKTYLMGGDLNPVVDHAMSIDGVEVSLFFKEDVPGRHRVSLRSRGTIDVNRIARHFGGGGHRNASGCAMELPLEEFRTALLEQVKRAMDDLVHKPADPDASEE
jgi:phosphoesterase RecJ-like protein